MLPYNSYNVTQQCAFFVDRALETALDPDGHFIQRGENSYVYLALQLNSGTITTFSETRAFIAGIKFLVYVPERFDQNHFQLSGKLTLDSHQKFLAYTHKLKLTATIDQSLFELGQKVVELGWNLKLGERLSGTVRLKNVRPKIPLLVAVSYPEGSLHLNANEIFIESTETGENDRIAELKYTFECKKYGYVTEFITLTNENNSNQEEY